VQQFVDVGMTFLLIAIDVGERERLQLGSGPVCGNGAGSLLLEEGSTAQLRFSACHLATIDILRL
jgi:hypothetical protein